MKRFIYSNALLLAIIGLSVAVTVVFVKPVFAETKAVVITTATVNKTSEAENKESTEEQSKVDTGEIREKAKGVWATVKAWGISVYEKIDAWRINQAIIWKNIKTEKELQIISLSEQTEENRNERVDTVLNGNTGTLFEGSSQDFTGTGNVFLLKLYVFALNVFLFIFNTPIIFYGIIAIVLLAVINKIIQKIQNPHGF